MVNLQIDPIFEVAYIKKQIFAALPVQGCTWLRIFLMNNRLPIRTFKIIPKEAAFQHRLIDAKDLYSLIERALQAHRINSFVQLAGDSKNLRVRFLRSGRKNKRRIIQTAPIMIRVHSLL
jgi:hypothetical protein